MFNKKLEGGHATLIENFNDEVITLVYPEDEKGYRNVTLNNLLKVIKLHGKENMAGFWLFKKINRK